MKKPKIYLITILVLAAVFLMAGVLVQKAEAAIVATIVPNASSTGNTGNGAATSITINLTSIPTTSDALIAVIGARASSTVSNLVTSISQANANWVKAVGNARSKGNTDGDAVEIWYALNVGPSAGTTITITLRSSLEGDAIVTEYSGIASASALDKIATSSIVAAPTRPTTGQTTTTTQADELWVGGLDASTTPTYSSPTNSFTLRAQIYNGGSSANAASVAYLDKIVSTTGQATTTATLSASAGWVGAIATFKAATSTISENAYGWFENLDSADLATIYENPSPLNDFVNTMFVDSSRGFMYVGGFDQIPGHDEWRFEKRKLSNGSLIYATSSDYGGSALNAMAIDNVEGVMYLVGGVSLSPFRWLIEKRNLSDGSLVYVASSTLASCLFITGSNCQATAISLDVTNGVMYLGGSDGSDLEWRIEKRYLADGSLVTTFGIDGVITENPSIGTIDEITALAIDTTSSVMYVVGKDTIPGNNEWRIEKRSLTDGSLIPSFGIGGATTTNPSSGVDFPNAIALDIASGTMYVAGKDASPGNQEWRIEKRNVADALLIYATTSNPSSGSDEAMAIVLDTALSTMYIGGYDSIPGDPNFQWRIEKRNTLNGSLATSTFGVNGVFTIRPNVGGNVINALALDKNNNALYAAGYDTTATSTDVEIHLEKINSIDGSSLDWGTPLALQNTSTTAPGQGTPFRLRMLLGISNNSLPLSGANFKLQFSQRSGTCDTGFSGESYSDVTATSVINYYNNPYPSDAASLISTANDLTYATDTIVNETYEESNPFTNSQAAIPAGSDGKWDFSLVDASSTPDTSYCFRVVKNDSNLLDNYNVIPEITTRGLAATISSASNQTFTINQAATTISPITITSGSGVMGAITASNDIRILIASTSVNMQWDTTRTTTTLSGTAIASTSANVSYPNPYTLFLNVTSDWSAGGNLTISNLAFTNFNSVNDATSSLFLYVAGSSDTTIDAVDDKSVYIHGDSIVSDYAFGQQGNLFDSAGNSLSDAELYRFVLAPIGENINVINGTIDITNVGGFSSDNIANPRLYLDSNGNGTIEVGEISVSATGTVSINNGVGTITFNGVWTATANTNIIMKADVSNIAEGNYLKFSLAASKINLKGATTVRTISANGNVSNANHAKTHKPRGGGVGPSGGEPPYGTPQGGGLPGGGGEAPPEATSTPGGGEGGGDGGSALTPEVRQLFADTLSAVNDLFRKLIGLIQR